MAKVLARTVLWYLVFIGFAINYMIRINVNITIVEMVLPKVAKLDNALQGIEVNSTTTTSLPSNQSMISVARVSQDLKSQHDIKKGNRFDWNEKQQNQILGSFYYVHWVTQIPGGILAKKYGTKKIFGLSNVVACWLCLLMPLAASWDYRAFFMLRTFQGLIAGFAWPSMHVLTAKWIPPNERSKFVAAYMGGSVGIAVFYPLFGFIMHSLSWEWVYYFSALAGTIWWLGWSYFVYDSPEIHPRIDPSECRYITKALGDSVSQGQGFPTPWKAILSSRAVWVNVIAQFGAIWGLFTMMTQTPTFFRFIHHWDIRSIGVLSGLPHLMRVIAAFCFSTFADWLLKTEKMSRTNVRKFSTAMGTIAHGFIILALACFGDDSTTAIVLVLAATAMHGTISAGPLAAVVDIAPNYAGIVLGLCTMIGVIPGFVSPWIVGLLTLNNQVFEAWRKVFVITATIMMSCGLVFVIWGDSTLQSWNSPQEEINRTEMNLLNPKEKEKQKTSEQ